MSNVPSGTTNIINGVTTVECQKQVRSWRLLRSLLELLIPSCNCNYLEEQAEEESEEKERTYTYNYTYKFHSCYSQPTPISTGGSIMTGTIFGYRRGKVSFCIQANSKTTTPLLLLELAVPTVILAKEMQGGLLRIALECSSNGVSAPYSHSGNSFRSSSTALLSLPVWTMYCNGKRKGLAIKRQPTQVDMQVLRLMRSVCVDAGIIRGKELNCEDELMYLRASFERVVGSSNSESFHLINPDGGTGQELSIFFIRIP